jgi:hypothetical protein
MCVLDAEEQQITIDITITTRVTMAVDIATVRHCHVATDTQTVPNDSPHNMDNITAIAPHTPHTTTSIKLTNGLRDAIITHTCSLPRGAH